MATPSSVSIMETLEVVSIISNFVFSFVLAVVGVLGYRYYLAISKSNKKEKAIELAKFYKDNVIDRLSIVEQAFKDLHLDEYVKKFNRIRHRSFDQTDLVAITYEETLKYIKAPFQNEVSNLISDILNCMEYFALNFTNGIADSDSIYQVIHQHYIETVETLSIDICVANIGKDEFKYYTNIIALYNEWKDISLHRQKLIDEAKGNALDKAKIANMKAKEDINKILYNK
jgi:hypothetical protein